MNISTTKWYFWLVKKVLVAGYNALRKMSRTTEVSFSSWHLNKICLVSLIRITIWPGGMFYLLDWLRKKISKWVNNSYPYSKNSSEDEDSKILSHPFSHHFIPNIKLSKNTRLIPNDSKSTHKDLTIISRSSDYKSAELYNIFFSMQRKIKKNNFYNAANQFCSYER